MESLSQWTRSVIPPRNAVFFFVDYCSVAWNRTLNYNMQWVAAKTWITRPKTGWSYPLPCAFVDISEGVCSGESPVIIYWRVWLTLYVQIICRTLLGCPQRNQCKRRFGPILSTPLLLIGKSCFRAVTSSCECPTFIKWNNEAENSRATHIAGSALQ